MARHNLSVSEDLLQLAHIFVAQLDRDARVISFNKYALELSGYKEEEIVGADWFETFIPPAHQDELRRLFKEGLDKDYCPPACEIVILSRDKQEIPLLVSLSFLCDENQVPYRVVLLGQNLSQPGLHKEQAEKRWESVIDYAKEGIYAVDLDTGNIVVFNDALCQMSGYSRNEIARMTISELRFPEDIDELHNKMEEVFKKGKVAWETRIRRKDGSPMFIELRSSIVERKPHRVCLSVISDITERKQAEEKLKYRLRFEWLIMEISTDLINAGVNEIDTVIHSALKKIGEFVGADRSYVFWIREDRIKMDNLYEWCAQGIEPQIGELKGLSINTFSWFIERLEKQGVVHIPRISALGPEAAAERKEFERGGIKSLINVPMVYNDSVVGFLGFDAVRSERLWPEESIVLLKIVGEIFASVLKRRQVERTLREGERFLASIFDSIQDGISILDASLNIVSVNSTMESWYAHAMPLLGKKCYEAYHGRNKPCEICPSCQTLKTQNMSYDIVPKRGPEGEVVGWLDLYTFPHIDATTGEMKGVIEYVRDITDRKRAEEILKELNIELKKSNRKLKQLALKDSHTGLYNHHYLSEVIESEFHRSKRYGLSVSVIMLDIDYFKSINDVYGHRFGDLVLKQLAHIFRKVVRRYDIVIRFGGEEFVFVLPDTDRQGALNLAQRILDKITANNFGTPKQIVHLKVSLGVASYPQDKVLNGMDLVNLADKILGKIKDRGGNNIYCSQDIGGKERSTEVEVSDSDNVKVLKEKISKLTKRANQSLMEAIYAFARTIKLKDNYTGDHVEKTVHYAVEMAKALGLSNAEIENISDAAMLHDLGKIGISERILLKRKKLTPREFEEIKRHPQIGADIIRPIHFLQDIIPLILYHHERYDGKGYLSGLRGEEIPLGARVIAIADVYQALISHRPYRRAYSKKAAAEIIKGGSGTQFDPHIAEIFLKITARER